MTDAAVSESSSNDSLVIDNFSEFLDVQVLSSLLRNFSYEDGLEGIDLLCRKSLNVSLTLPPNGPDGRNYVSITLNGVIKTVESQWFYGATWALNEFFPDGLNGTVSEVLLTLEKALTPPYYACDEQEAGGVGTEGEGSA